ncbi:MAG: hypothetical protein OYK82_11685 [Gammaproteobacteria bacterium]|nr:hypothetical protein [Gammaproteobacteria bacterium]
MPDAHTSIYERWAFDDEWDAREGVWVVQEDGQRVLLGDPRPAVQQPSASDDEQSLSEQEQEQST